MCDKECGKNQSWRWISKISNKEALKEMEKIILIFNHNCADDEKIQKYIL